MLVVRLGLLPGLGGSSVVAELVVDSGQVGPEDSRPVWVGLAECDSPEKVADRGLEAGTVGWATGFSEREQAELSVGSAARLIRVGVWGRVGGSTAARTWLRWALAWAR
jgi:hypothetical protein